MHDLWTRAHEDGPWESCDLVIPVQCNALHRTSCHERKGMNSIWTVDGVIIDGVRHSDVWFTSIERIAPGTLQHGLPSRLHWARFVHSTWQSVGRCIRPH